MEERDKIHFLRGIITGIGMVAVVILYWILILKPTIFPADLSQDDGMSYEQMMSMLQKTNSIMNHIQDEYILEDLENEALIEGMYEGLMAMLDDKYAEYYTVEEYEELKKQTEGSWGGIGISVTQDKEIVSVFENSPAQQAGVEIGDIIQMVNDQDVTAMTLDEMKGLLKGKIGDVKKVKFYRPSTEESYEVELTLAEIITQTIFWHMLEDGIVYLQITSFDTVTMEQFDEAWQEIAESGEMKGLVLDLRDNLGGNLTTVVHIANELLPEGLITYIEDKAGNRTEYSSEGDGCDVPMAVLVNGSSASASELLCGALKDRGMATVVGTTTYGKGIVQTTWSMGDGTAFKMTTGKYYTPNGNNIQGTGIEPDIYIELGAEEQEMESVPQERDVQLQTAIEAVKTKLGQ